MKIVRLFSLMLAVIMILSACNSPSIADDTLSEGSTNTEALTDDTVNTLIEETEEQKEKKEVKNILMVGNSFCYYYVEELCGLALADGKEINVANLYYSGCSLEKHWSFYTSGAKEYNFYLTSKKGRSKLPVYTLDQALSFARSKLGDDWDVISLQQSSSYTRTGDLASAQKSTLPYSEKIYAVIREACPDAKLYWHQTWSYDIGYGADKSNEKDRVDTPEKQRLHYETVRELSYIVAKAEGASVVPSGDAWQIARENPVVGNTLCQRKGVNNGLGDYYHDGDIGGGQYLNACVWYEVLFGKSCIGNTYRPDNYELSEEKIDILQKAAHEAVAAVYGEDYAK